MDQQSKLDRINSMLEDKKAEVNNYASSMDTKIMSVTNAIANLTKQCD